MATKQGCIGITGTNARPSVAPTFGVDGMFGTNPLTIGFQPMKNLILLLIAQLLLLKTVKLSIMKE